MRYRHIHKSFYTRPNKHGRDWRGPPKAGCRSRSKASGEVMEAKAGTPQSPEKRQASSFTDICIQKKAPQKKIIGF